jgi:hypothetical protein
MNSQPSSPLALVARALVTERLDLVEGVGEGIDDAVFIRIAGALVRQRRAPRYRLDKGTRRESARTDMIRYMPRIGVLPNRLSAVAEQEEEAHARSE